jgi:hypothetical protein
VPAALALLVWRWWRGPLTRAGLDATPDRPRGFGYKCTWLAVRADSAEEVARALALGTPVPCNWASGFARVFGAIGARGVFVTPPVEGWVFAIGVPIDDDDALDTMAELSAALGRPVHAFGSHRGVSAASWIVAEDGSVRRAWGIADGERIFDRGEVTPEERALDISFDAEPSGDDDERWSRQSDESTVIALAAAWTRDPTTLDAVETPGVGLLLRR